MIQALLFDVFGTVVDWRSGISRDFELISKKYGLKKNSQQFADDWRAEYQPSMEKVRSGNREFVKLDILHDENLKNISNKYGLDVITYEDWKWLVKSWHRLPGWDDSSRGLLRLKSKFIIASQSNGNIELILNMSKYSKLYFLIEKENLHSKSFFTGDIMLDIFLKTKNYLDQTIVNKTFPEEFYLFTLHRKENLEDKNKLNSIIDSLYDFSNLIIPIHHSFKNKLMEYDLLESLPENIELVEPLVYSDLLLTIKNSKGVITDSGGLQKEAYWFNKPILTLRENTEWTETIENGLNVLVNEFVSLIIGKLIKYLDLKPSLVSNFWFRLS